MEKLLTRKELAELLGVSTRTIDRYRSMSVDLGEVKLGYGSPPRFDPAKVRKAIEVGRFTKAKRLPDESVPKPPLCDVESKEPKVDLMTPSLRQEPQPDSGVAL